MICLSRVWISVSNHKLRIFCILQPRKNFCSLHIHPLAYRGSFKWDGGGYIKANEVDFLHCCQAPKRDHDTIVPLNTPG